MPEDIVRKIEHYCAYQERCHHEVRNKLLSLGCRGEELEHIIAHLITNNFMNEERYAKTYARGKHSLKKWGRRKIIQSLKLKHISEYCIKKAMTEIDPDAYYETLKKLASDKIHACNGDSHLMVKKKVYAYLLGKGYEYDLIEDAWSELKQ